MASVLGFAAATGGTPENPSRGWAAALNLILGVAATHLLDRLFSRARPGAWSCRRLHRLLRIFFGNLADIALVVGVSPAALLQPARAEPDRCRQIREGRPGDWLSRATIAISTALQDRRVKVMAVTPVGVAARVRTPVMVPEPVVM